MALYFGQVAGLAMPEPSAEPVGIETSSAKKDSQNERLAGADRIRQRIRAKAVSADVSELEPDLNNLCDAQRLDPVQFRRQLAVEWVNLAAAAAESGQPDKARRLALQAVKALEALRKDSRSGQLSEEEVVAVEEFRAFIVENFISGVDEANAIRRAVGLRVRLPKSSTE